MEISYYAHSNVGVCVCSNVWLVDSSIILIVSVVSATLYLFTIFLDHNAVFLGIFSEIKKQRNVLEIRNETDISYRLDIYA